MHRLRWTKFSDLHPLALHSFAQQRQSLNIRTLSGLTVVAGAATLWYNARDECQTSTSQSAQCAADLPLPVANPKEGHFLQQFQAWLSKRQCDTHAIDIKPSLETPAAGVGVFLSEGAAEKKLRRSWWQWWKSWIAALPDTVLAFVPFESIVCTRTITADPKLGRLYSTLLETGSVTERQLIMLFLIVERIRGLDSEWAPWIGVLPQAFNTPLFFGKAEMDELKGTTLFSATSVLERSLRSQWTSLSPFIEQVLRETGPATQGLSATFDDFKWAYSIFWSRSITFPAPIRPMESEASLAAISKDAGTEPSEAIVPGIDFCNHSPLASCRWSVWNPAVLKENSPAGVGLVCAPTVKLKPGAELQINYGEKSNEELLMQYGFTIDNNSRDALMIVLDLGPPSQWDAATEAKMRILISKDQRPQLFLTQAKLDSRSAENGDTLGQVGLDEDNWEVLETLLMDDDSAIATAELLGGSESSALECPAVSPHPSDQSVQAEGRRLALLTTLVRVLDHKCEELLAGTGPLENDIKILEGVKPTSLPQVYSSVVYRAAQKRLAQGFQSKARKALARQMVRMQALEGHSPR